MGIIDDFGKKIVKNTVLLTAMSAIEAADKRKREKGMHVGQIYVDSKDSRYKSERQYLSQSPESTYFIIQRLNHGNELFKIYDKQTSEIYHVKGQPVHRNIRLQLYDKNNHKIGSVREKILNVKMMLDEQMYPADFIIKTGFMDSIELKSILYPTNRTEELKIEPYGWHIGGKFIGYDYTIKNGDIEIAHIVKRKGYDMETYFLDFLDESMGIIVLLIFLAMIVKDGPHEYGIL